MPIYEFQCTHCHLLFEKVVKVGEKDLIPFLIQT